MLEEFVGGFCGPRRSLWILATSRPVTGSARCAKMGDHWVRGGDHSLSASRVHVVIQSEKEMYTYHDFEFAIEWLYE